MADQNDLNKQPDKFRSSNEGEKIEIDPEPSTKTNLKKKKPRKKVSQATDKVIDSSIQQVHRDAALAIKEAEEQGLTGSNTILTRDLIDKISKLMTLGLEIGVASAVYGISFRVMRSWIIKGLDERDSKNQEGDRDLYRDLAKAVLKASGQAEFRDLQMVDMFAHGRKPEYLMVPMTDSKGEPYLDGKGNPIMTPMLDGEGRPIVSVEAIKPNWQAAAWKLERRTPMRWGATTRLMIDPIVAALDNVTGLKTEATAEEKELDISEAVYQQKAKTARQYIDAYFKVIEEEKKEVEL